MQGMNDEINPKLRVSHQPPSMLSFIGEKRNEVLLFIFEVETMTEKLLNIPLHSYYNKTDLDMVP